MARPTTNAIDLDPSQKHSHSTAKKTHSRTPAPILNSCLLDKKFYSSTCHHPHASTPRRGTSPSDSNAPSGFPPNEDLISQNQVHI